MKNPLLWLPLAFVVGGLIGAWGPSEELRALRERPSATERPSGKQRRGFDAFARMVNIPDVARARSSSRPSPGRPAVSNAVVAAADSAGKRPVPDAGEDRGRMDPEDLRMRIDEAAELWRTRSELVRARAIESLGLDGDGEAGFDAAVARMNDEIRASVQAIADALANEEEMTPELGVRLIGDLSATMAGTYDLIGEAAGEEHRGDVSNLQLVELVDPSVAEPLIAVQDKLEALPARRRR